MRTLLEEAEYKLEKFGWWSGKLSAMEKLALKSEKGSFFQIVVSYIMGQEPSGTQEEWRNIFHPRDYSNLYKWVMKK